MLKITALKSSLKKFSPAAIGTAALAFAGSASADNLAEVQAAIDSGKAIVEKASGGLIMIAAVVAGVALVVALLKR